MSYGSTGFGAAPWAGDKQGPAALGLTTITIETWGAAGQVGSPNSSVGLGGYVKASYTMMPGTVLYVRVGGQSSVYGGGASAGGAGAPFTVSGGDYSAVLKGSNNFSPEAIIQVGGGGGGAAMSYTSFAHGGMGGINATSGTGDSVQGLDGGGATQSAGGTGGSPFGSGNPGTPGTLGQGGVGGASAVSTIGPGGSGGGGYYGGGGAAESAGAGGSQSGSGGGGSSYYNTAAGPNQITVTDGTQSGLGLVKITANGTTTTFSYTGAVQTFTVPVAALGTLPLGTATAAGFVPTPKVIPKPPLGTATAAGFAPSVIFTKFVHAPLGTASAKGFLGGISPPVGHATAIGSAPAVKFVYAPPRGTASAIGRAPSTTVLQRAPLGHATAAGPPPSIGIPVGMASAQGFSPHLNRTVNVPRGAASARGLTPVPTVRVVLPLGTAAALGRTPIVERVLGLGRAQVTGLRPEVINAPTVQVGVASSAGFVSGAQLLIHVPLGRASATGGFTVPTITVSGPGTGIASAIGNDSHFVAYITAPDSGTAVDSGRAISLGLVPIFLNVAVKQMTFKTRVKSYTVAVTVEDSLPAVVG